MASSGEHLQDWFDKRTGAADIGGAPDLVGAGLTLLQRRAERPAGHLLSYEPAEPEAVHHRAGGVCNAYGDSFEPNRLDAVTEGRSREADHFDRELRESRNTRLVGDGDGTNDGDGLD